MKKVERKKNRNKKFLVGGKLLPLFFTLIFILTACGSVLSETLTTTNVKGEIIVIDNNSTLLSEQILLTNAISENQFAENSKTESQISINTSLETTSETKIEDTSETVLEAEVETVQTGEHTVSTQNIVTTFNIEDIPKYSDFPYIVVNDNIPFFTDEELTGIGFEEYSELDELGRCGVALASVGLELMPTEPRESISSVYPTGWEQAQYDFVSGGYLYNRSHLLGFQLTGENANELNLITGTRSFNVEGMLPFENMIADYVKETENHVMFRVTPVFKGENLLATGVLMEAKSVEDNGEGILFNVFCYNAENGVVLDYGTGKSSLGELYSEEAEHENDINSEDKEEIIIIAESNIQDDFSFVLNTNTKKIHIISCRYVDTISENNREESRLELAELISQGYESCKVCL